jgi:hypothetical protein
MYGGEISGFYTSGNSTPISVGGTFNMYGGKIYGNRGENAGGAVRINGTFNMYGGTIYGNSEVDVTLRNTAYVNRGASIFKTTHGRAWYGNGDPIIAGDQTTDLATDDTIIGHN